MPMQNLLKYSDNDSMKSGSLWKYYRDEVNYDGNENDSPVNKINNGKLITRTFFKYKSKIIGGTPDDNNTLDTKVVVRIKFLEIS